jgi:hypothetical protein
VNILKKQMTKIEGMEGRYSMEMEIKRKQV